MTEFAKGMKLKDYTVNTCNSLTEETGITRSAESIGANLIVMGTHSRVRLAHLVSGSVAEDAVNHSPIPVLTHHFKLRQQKVAALKAH